ncbi:hypothetical protein BD626DRAFT_541610 [Schizophyllum amplum]|uniref:Uncharacterized protein n=1 Tax=Schizophyllum amplum TaxID=97359 RepID=A0A550BTV4_9AGAR|nr:hypothetical protein BD626DRAFT_541610 [Auriculariopsis ampla]
MDRSRSSTGSTNSAGFSQDVPSYQMRTAGSDIGTYANIDDWMVYSALPRQQSAASRLTASESSFWEGMGTANIDMPSSALCIDASASFGPSSCACLSGMCRCTSSVECWSAGDLAGGSQTLSDSISVSNMPDPSSMSTMSDPIPLADSISTSAMPDLMHSRSSSSSSSSGASSLQSFRDVVGAGSGGGWASMSGSTDDLFGAPVIDGFW